MKVRVAFEITEPTLRRIRAAAGRGGVATRKDCVAFVQRAFAGALSAAPEPKPARRPKVKSAPTFVVDVADTPEAVRVVNDKIRKRFGR